MKIKHFQINDNGEHIIKISWRFSISFTLFIIIIKIYQSTSSLTLVQKMILEMEPMNCCQITSTAESRAKKFIHFSKWINIIPIVKLDLILLSIFKINPITNGFQSCWNSAVEFIKHISCISFSLKNLVEHLNFITNVHIIS